ncbi:hypothetical protein ES703_49148 [subsurface metagenome]
MVKILHGIYIGGNERNLVPELADLLAAGHGHGAVSAVGCRQGRIADPQGIGWALTSGSVLRVADTPGPAAISAVVDFGANVSPSYQ